ncbi:unnamed protein product [Rotaria magnacalcarata]|uniref:Uncharacterized protein n=1 Tax=Rotaria magnacalcarata TaxID=392030 RepID=A0A819PM31_9BILA|nr:unnamed protein product [Rotaria magnacalcarata]CAF4016541.1 unnamed protein product [Rotaria magnacalcarata]
MALSCTEFRAENDDNLAECKEQHDNYKQNQYGIKFRYFNHLKIEEALKNSKQFCQALSMVEDLIDNDNLCCYYSYVCNAELRFKNIFNFEEAKTVIGKTRMFIVNLCNLIEFIIGVLPNEYSIFRGDPIVTSHYRDHIMIDKTVIDGFCVNQTDSTARFHMEVFFVFSKILHELGHALSYHCARVYLTNEKDINKKFETPKTHCLQGESGNAIERLLFGSVIDAPGRMQDDKYIIQYLILPDGRISAVIDEIWISSFVNDALNMHKLKTIDPIEPIPFKFLTKNLKRKLECGSKDFQTKRTCSKLKILDPDWSDSDDIEYQLTYTTVKV